MAGINDSCIGCGVCESIDSEIFKVEDGVAKIIKKLIPEDKEKYDEAKEACPVNAIEDF